MLSAQLDAGENAPFGSRVLILLQIRSIQVFFTMWEVNARKAICWTGSRAAGPTEAGDFHEERRAGRARVGARKRDWKLEPARAAARLETKGGVSQHGGARTLDDQ